ncbi:hypothetical protein RhiirC2_309363 [Rhizophagus irregularis]|uniref:Uncharacterized protein n=1 Tax=Rhizophagus irregularis TaxID=588596 RepID=A0A2N1MBN7_9GLOM|nr:hypothetical protein RhiirC2_309363 [Rhizophagus irregularis]
MKFTTLACLAILGISTLNEVNAAPIAEIGINNKRDTTPSYDYKDAKDDKYDDDKKKSYYRRSALASPG